MTQIKTLKYLSQMNWAGTERGHKYIIAGGAVRDTDYGKPLKDIDIFCLYNPDNFDVEREIEAQGPLLPLSQELTRHEIGEYEQNFNGIHSVWDSVIEFDGYRAPVQLIFQPATNADLNINEVTDNFDLTTSQITLVSKDIDNLTIAKSEGYKQSKLDNTIRLTDFGKAQTIEQRRKTKERAQRFRTKLDLAIELRWNDGEVYSALRPSNLRQNVAAMNQQAVYHSNPVWYNPAVWNIPLRAG